MIEKSSTFISQSFIAKLDYVQIDEYFNGHVLTFDKS